MLRKIFNQPTCLDDVYSGTHYKYTWRCSEGHIWKAEWNQIHNQKTRCPYCAGQKGTAIDDLKILAESRGGKCLDKKYINTHYLYSWKCDKKHIWSASYDSLKRGSWCPYCAGQKGTTIDDLKVFAKFKGGKCLDKKYTKAHSYYTWECDKKHTWDARWVTMKSKNSWCPYCYGHKGTTIKTLQEHARNKEGKCLDRKYVNSHHKYKWKCKENHIWQASWTNINQNKWCPKCYSKNKSLPLTKISKKELEILLWEMPIDNIAKKINIHRTTIYDLIKRFKITNKPQKGYWRGKRT